jgi:hypothetical protein
MLNISFDFCAKKLFIFKWNDKNRRSGKPFRQHKHVCQECRSDWVQVHVKGIKIADQKVGENRQ